MKLIVGIGNIGKAYDNTRHNVGFMAIDFYVQKNNLTKKEKFNGEYYEEIKEGEKIIYLKPLSYVNNSGIVVSKYVDFFKISLEDVFVIYDDLSFPIGIFKLKPSGSSAGHNGMKSIIECLRSEDIKRLKIGISKNKGNIINYVLGKFNKQEKKIISKIIKTSYDIIDEFSNTSFDKLMNKYNTR